MLASGRYYDAESKVQRVKGFNGQSLPKLAIIYCTISRLDTRRSNRMADYTMTANVAKSNTNLNISSSAY
jgi:hypothetical protein